MVGDMWVKVLLLLTIWFSSRDTLPQNTFISSGVTGVQAESKEAMKKHGHALLQLHRILEQREKNMAKYQIDSLNMHSACSL